MTPIDYFKLQSKNLYKDFKTKKPCDDDGGITYEYEPRFFAIEDIILDFGIDETQEFTLMQAQHIIANMVGFEKWADLKKAPYDHLKAAQEFLENHEKNQHDSTGFYGHNFTEDGKDRVFFKHGSPNHDDFEILQGQERLDGVKECRDAGFDFADDEVIECYHCSKTFTFGEVQVASPKEDVEYPFGEIGRRAMVYCKHFPKCDGGVMDFFPEGTFEGKQS